MFERIKQIKANNSNSKLVTSVVLAATVSVLSAVSYAGNSHDAGAKKMNKAGAVTPITRVEPKYPIQAAEDKIEGSVVLKFDIKSDGSVENVSVIDAEPKKVFDKTSKIALRQWKYSPSNGGSKNHLVQLDYALDKNSNHKFTNLTETIRVTR